MAITTYVTLRTAVESWSLRTDFPSDVYGLATAEINRRLRVREMLSDLSGTITAETLALPSDFLAVDHAYLDRDPRVVLTAADEASKDSRYRSSGTPVVYTVTQSNFLFMPIPDGSYTFAGRYYAKLADFSGDSDTNSVITKYPELYLYGSLIQVFSWTVDQEQESGARARFESYLAAANDADIKSQYGGPVSMTPRAVA